MGSDRGWAWTLVPFAIIVWVVSVISLIRGGEVMGSDRLTEIAEAVKARDWQGSTHWDGCETDPRHRDCAVLFLLGEIQRLTLARAQAEQERDEALATLAARFSPHPASGSADGFIEGEPEDGR